MKEMNTLSAYDRATILESRTKMDERREEFAEIIAKRLQNQYVLQGEK